MIFQPANGFLLLQPCEDPFEKGPLEVVRDEMHMKFGRVLSLDGSGKPYQQEGAIVFYLASSAVKIVLDREEVFTLLHEGQVMGFIPATASRAVKSKTVQVKPRQETPLQIAPAAALAALES